LESGCLFIGWVGLDECEGEDAAAAELAVDAELGGADEDTAFVFIHSGCDLAQVAGLYHVLEFDLVDAAI